ncbi:MAG: SH3 domain-containing protein [Nitrospinae bacterium]|nr:SH3 domain-containing protein [Nitrospinota bacterium]
MISKPLWRVWLAALLLALGACATAKTPYHETAPSQLLKEDQRLFSDALDFQKKGQLPSAIEAWRKFIKLHPRSYEAHNNLGMSYYANDQLSLSIEEFEKALDLEPTDAKTKENLLRALKFETTLLTENKEYDKAIENWESIADLAPEEKEKIAFTIEGLQEKIYEQVKRSNTLDDYKSFAEHYPDSPYAEDAQKRIETLSREHSGVIGFDLPGQTVSPTEAPLTMGEMGAPPGKLEEESVGNKMPEMKPAQPARKEMEPPPPVAAPATPAPKPAEEAKPSAPEPTPSPEAAKPAKVKKVQITSKSALRVRAAPSLKAKALTRLKKGTIVTLLEDKGGWYKIQFGKGKSGWISKKYSKLAK